MSSVTAADLKLGGRIIAACDAVGAGHLRRAAGIFNEVADDLNAEAEAATGLLSEEVQEKEKTALVPLPKQPEPAAPQLAVSTSAAAGMEMCTKNVHSYGPPDPISGWRTCSVCEMVNVAPEDNNGFVDMSARQ